MLDRDGVGVGVEIGQRLKLGHPGAINCEAKATWPASLYISRMMFLRKSFSDTSGPESAAEIPSFVGPLFEFGIMCNTPFKRDRVEFGAARAIYGYCWDHRLRGA